MIVQIIFKKKTECMRTFFTSDTHFFHHRIIQFCARPFASSEEMNEAIVTIWNHQVGKNDRVYHLGDVSFGNAPETLQLLHRLNGEICLIIGNHDDKLIRHAQFCERFYFIKPYHEEKIEDYRVVLCHYPIAQWRDAQCGKSWHLYGHTHGAFQLDGQAMDVGLDAHPEFRLWCWDEIKSILSKRQPLPYLSKPTYPKRQFSLDWQFIRSDIH